MTVLNDTTPSTAPACVTPERLLSDTPTMNLCRDAGIVEFRSIGTSIWEIIGTGSAGVTVSTEDGTVKAKSEMRRPFFCTVLPGRNGAFPAKEGGLIVLLREGQEKADRLKVWEDIARHYDAICHDHPTIKPALDTYLSGDYGGMMKVITIGGKP